MDNLKDKLFSTGYFEDNDWLNKYTQLIENNKNTKQESGITQTHHIIQKSYFKLINQPCDNSYQNLVNLKYSDHILAHYYLCYCTKNELKASNYLAFKLMTDTAPKDFNLIEFCNSNRIKYDEWYKNYCIINSERHSGEKCYFYGKHFYGKDNPMYGKHHSEETKNKISESLKQYYKNHEAPNKGKSHTEETKRKISEIKKEYYKTHDNSRKGTKLSEETILKIKYGRTWPSGKNHPCARKVRCIEDNKIFDTIVQAAQYYNLDNSNIGKVCRGVAKTCGGYHWEYID